MNRLIQCPCGLWYARTEVKCAGCFAPNERAELPELALVVDDELVSAELVSASELAEHFDP